MLGRVTSLRTGRPGAIGGRENIVDALRESRTRGGDRDGHDASIGGVHAALYYSRSLQIVDQSGHARRVQPKEGRHFARRERMIGDSTKGPGLGETQASLVTDLALSLVVDHRVRHRRPDLARSYRASSRAGHGVCPSRNSGLRA